MYMTTVLSIPTHLFSGQVLTWHALPNSSQNWNINFISSFTAAHGSQQKQHKLTRYWFNFFFLNLLQLHRAEQQNAKANCKLRKTPVHWLLSWNQQSSFPNIGWVKGTVIIIILQKLTALNRKRWQLHWSSSKLPAKCKEEHNLSRTWICKGSRTRALLQTGILSEELHFIATEIHFPPTNSLFNLIHRILLVAVCL